MIPKALRDRLGLGPGVVEVMADGAALRVEPMAADDLETQGGRLVIPALGAVVDDDVVRLLRHADQR